MTYGPDPWLQKSWDWRAAGNFICGGAGSGLIVFAVASGAAGAARAALLLSALALIGLGLTLVWLEIGRPLRALHVFFNPFTSWMTRESFAALLLLPAGLAAAFGVPGFDWVAAALALAFVYCQARILQAAKGIPAWREPSLVPLVVATGLAEGGGLFLLAGVWHEARGAPLVLAFAALAAVRAALWLRWRRRLAARVAPRALATIDRTGRLLLWAGAALPIALVAPAAAWPAAGGALAALAGLLAAAAGVAFKFDLVCRAAFNQGFALAHVPVRGARS